MPRHEQHRALELRSGAGGAAAGHQRGDLAGVRPAAGSAPRHRRGAHGGAARRRGLRPEVRVRADLALVDPPRRAGDGAGRGVRAGAAPGAALCGLVGLWPRQCDAAAGRRAGHALRRGGGDRPATLVCAAIRPAHSRHGARQYADQRQPGAADADRGRRARAGSHRGAHRAGGDPLRGIRAGVAAGDQDRDDAAPQHHERGRHRQRCPA